MRRRALAAKGASTNNRRSADLAAYQQAEVFACTDGHVLGGAPTHVVAFVSHRLESKLSESSTKIMFRRVAQPLRVGPNLV